MSEHAEQGAEVPDAVTFRQFDDRLPAGYAESARRGAARRGAAASVTAVTASTPPTPRGPTSERNA
jgi:hypothetical protein